MADGKVLRLTGTIAGFAFDVTAHEIADEELGVTGKAGGAPVALHIKLADDGFTLSGLLLGKDCAVTGSKSQ